MTLQDSSTSLSIVDRLLSAEDEFSSAIVEGGQALVAFNERWERLLIDVDACEAGVLDTSTSSLIHTVATRISELAEASIDLYTTCNSLTSELMTQLDLSMVELSLHDSAREKNSVRSLSQPRSDVLSPHGPDTVMTHRKRRHSSEPSCVRPCKRTRTTVVAEATNPPCFARCRPSLPPRLKEPLEDIEHTEGGRTLKRRRSEANLDDTSAGDCKRLYTGPRLHAVSDSFVPHRVAAPREALPAIDNPPSLEGTLPYHPIPLDIRPMVQEYCESSFAPLAQVELSTEFDSTSNPVYSVGSPEDDSLTTFINSLLNRNVVLADPTTGSYADACNLVDHAPAFSEPDTCMPERALSPFDPDSPSSHPSEYSPSYPVTPLLLPSVDLCPLIYDADLSSRQASGAGQMYHKSPSHVAVLHESSGDTALPWYMESPDPEAGILCPPCDWDTITWLSAPPPYCLFPEDSAAVTHNDVCVGTISATIAHPSEKDIQLHSAVTTTPVLCM